MKKYLRHPVVQNALALYSLQVAEYLLPMVTVPYLARVLLPAAWGIVVYAQSFSLWLIVVLEYGFGFSATREIARQRDNPDRQAEVAAGVFGANFLLLVPALLVGIFSRFAAPQFRQHPAYLWLALLLAFTQGVRPIWYFQGIEDMRIVAAMNVVGRLVYAAGIFFLVRSPGDGWIVLTLQAVSAVLVSILLCRKMFQSVAFRMPTLQRAIPALRLGWTIFLSRSATSLYTLANTFILGLFASSASVAYYGGAERVILAVLSLMGPFTQALYPRMSHLAANNQQRAASAIRMGLLFFSIAGLVTGVALILMAPWVVRILLGPDYQPAIGVMRVAALIVPLVAVSNILGLQWLLPFGMDREFNRISIAGALVNVVLAVILSREFGAVGTAWSVVTVQLFVTGSQCFLFARWRSASNVGAAVPYAAQSPHS